MKAGWSVRLSMGILLLAGATAPVQAASKIMLPRPGQVGIGVQGGYGTLLEGGDLGDLFADGASIAVRMRYRMRFERAIGISFESQTFDARVAGAVGDTVAKKMTLIMTGFDIYQMFDTREKTMKMLNVGIGLARPSVELSSKETTFPEDGFYVCAGAGLEHFFWRSWAWDLSVRYHAIFQRSKINNDFQAAFGVILYAAQ